jgi:hypothetical protein
LNFVRKLSKNSILLDFLASVLGVVLLEVPREVDGNDDEAHVQLIDHNFKEIVK